MLPLQCRRSCSFGKEVQLILVYLTLLQLLQNSCHSLYVRLDTGWQKHHCERLWAPVKKASTTNNTSSFFGASSQRTYCCSAQRRALAHCHTFGDHLTPDPADRLASAFTQEGEAEESHAEYQDT